MIDQISESSVVCSGQRTARYKQNMHTEKREMTHVNSTFSLIFARHFADVINLPVTKVTAYASKNTTLNISCP